MKFVVPSVGLFALVMLVAACESEASRSFRAHSDSVAAIRADSVARALQDSTNRARPDYVIDSLLPVEEEIRRFKAAIGGEPVTALSGGSDSRELLIARFTLAVERSDTAEFRKMIITAREFIDLIYPESPNTQPPYHQPPGFIWAQNQLVSSKGISRLLERRGGRHLNVLGVHCSLPPDRQGRNTLWVGCLLDTTDDASAGKRERLFGAIVERAGRWKFISYANGY
jgi:hypothetical protein